MLLGVAAAVSHSLVIWGLAAVGLYFGNRFDAEHFEPYFQLVSGALIVITALWMVWRTHREVREASVHEHGHHDHEHNHEPHDHEGAGHAHHDHPAPAGLPGSKEYEDAHQRAHSHDIEQRFAGRNVTTGQIIVFGLTGGLLPCPASLTILLVCLQLKQFVLGFSLVLAFSVGLALTLVTVGAAAAWSVHHASRRWAGFGNLGRRLPYLSAAVLTTLGLYMGLQGWWHLPR